MTSWPTPRAWLYGWVDTTAPGYRTVEIGGTEVTAAPGHYRFPEWIAALDTAAGAEDWTVSLAASGHVTFAGPSAALGATDRAAWLAGLDLEPGDELAAASSVESVVAPPGAVPLLGATWEEIKQENEENLQVDRQLRGHGYTWGGAEVWRLKLVMHRAGWEALQAGWCLRGPVTIAHSTDLSEGAWSSANPRGYVDAHVLGVSTSWPSDTRQIAEVSLLVVRASGAAASGTPTLDDLLERGASTLLSATVEGIPWVFTEREARQATSAAAPGVPTGYEAAVPALFIAEGQAVSVEVDRDTGVAAGKAWEMILSFAGLEDAELGKVLFRRPEVDANITTDVDATDTTIAVDDETGFAEGDLVYIGRECLRVTGTAEGELTVDRAVAGYAYAYLHSAASTYRRVTSSPLVWRGRLVTLYEHAISREGRMLDGTVGEAGAYSRVLWRGFIDDFPMQQAAGWRLRAQALPRLLAKDLGYDVGLRVIDAPDVRQHLLVVGPTDTVQVRVRHRADGSASIWDSDDSWTLPSYTPDADPEVMTYGEWWDRLVADLEAEVAGAPWLPTGGAVLADDPLLSVRIDGRYSFAWRVRTADGYRVQVTISVPAGGPYWLAQGGSVDTGASGLSGRLLVEPSVAAGGWLPVEVIAGEGLQDAEVPAQGIGTVEGQEGTEIVRWSEVLTHGDTVAMVRLAARGISGTPEVYLPGGTMNPVVGFAGKLRDGIAAILQSSGTGLRGDSDTLALGLGLGVPEAMMDAITSDETLQQQVVLVEGGRASAADLIGGWLSLLGRCMSMVDGVLTIVHTDPVGDPEARIISAADVLLERIEPTEQRVAPNEIRVDTSGLDEGDKVIVRDVTAVQAEGPRTRDLKVPGISMEDAEDAAWLLLKRGSGQVIVRLTLAPWARVQTGERLRLELAHPMLYDWGSGTRAPQVIDAMVLAVETDLVSGAHAATLVLDGLGDTTRWLCPSAEVVTVDDTDEVTVTSAEWFSADDVVTIYTPGAEATEEATARIAAISGDVVTFTAALPAWVAAGTVMTFPPYDNATTAQRAYAYVRPDTRWT